MDESRPKTTRHDVELAQSHNSTRITLSVVYGIFTVIGIAVSSLPLRYVYLAAKELAGKETKISMGLALTVSVGGVAAIIKGVVDHGKMKRQGAELARLRERCRILEENQPKMARIVAQGKK